MAAEDPVLAQARSIFVADDSAVARSVIVRAIREAGFAVVEGASAALAPTVDVGALSCALLDLDLGDGDGTELAQALLRASPGLPVAFFSAGASAELLARAGALGPVFAKPDELDQAVAWIQENAT